MTLREDIQTATNRHNAENVSNTPDFILAIYLESCLLAFDTAVQQRETWHGRDSRPSLPGTPVAPDNTAAEIEIEIEMTPEMIRAGVFQLAKANDTEENAVRWIYEAMVETRRIANFACAIAAQSQSRTHRASIDRQSFRIHRITLRELCAKVHD